MLSISGVTKRFGGLVAVRECSFDIERNSITGLIGPNGSGKTTLLNVVNGFYELDGGDVYLDGKSLRGLRAYRIAQMGIGRTFQIVKVFRNMTAFENMLAGMPETSNKQKMKGRALDLLRFVDLIHLKDEYASNLSYGQQKLLEFARALMPDPQLMLLDEPVAGINPGLITKILEYIKELQDQGKTFLIVEHNMPVVMGLCEKIVVLDQGEKIAEGTPKEIQGNQRVVEAYLGD